MERGVNAGGIDALETISAAATAIASVEAASGARASVQKRWGSCFNIWWCFGLNKSKRIGSAIIVPDASVTNPDSTAAQNPSQQPAVVLPFVAPPSSPVSFLPSETPSVVQSPTAMLSTINISVDMYFPGCSPSIFSVGPYAHETQLVSPPVFSSFPTEPSTAPYTPPPESVHLTTPSSPEVPFAQLLEPALRREESCQRYQLCQYEFQYYHLQPGSPVSHLISPCSGISYSGTSSPFRDTELGRVNPFFLKDAQSVYPPKLLDLEKIVLQEWGSHPGSAVVTPRAGFNLQISDASSLSKAESGPDNQEPTISFDMKREGVIPPAEPIPVAARHKVKKNVEPVEEQEAVVSEEKSECPDPNNPSEEQDKSCQNQQQHEKRRTVTLGSSKEFIFDAVDGAKRSEEPQMGGSSMWWANEAAAVVAEDGSPSKNWPFFPGVS